ncbi:MAG: endolytic transglycosylase MltG [Proteobacteria bacterium]|nr:endolytic transglycosylase MltG [Pseudomonadota bacterium]
MRIPARGRGLIGTLLVLVLLGAGALLLGYHYLVQQYRAPGPAAQAARIEVAPGSSLRSVLARLQAQGVVANARAISWYLKLKNQQVRVESGVYEIPAHASPEAILQLFAEGRVVLEQLTVVEGATFAEFIALLDAHPAVAHTLRGRTPGEVMAALGHPGELPEGRFFPDTYRFAARSSDAAVLTLAYDAMQRALDSAWESRAPGLPFSDPAQALILASMVEKEAALKSERALIAGVFIERLRKGMRLQSDPTVIYGLGAAYDGTIHTRDLQADNPYNTYTREGLPPGPICLPGRESLVAAVHPEESGALYFVATGLGDGAHHFSRTLEEHNAAVQAYLKHLRAPPHAAQGAGSAAPPGRRR